MAVIPNISLRLRAGTFSRREPGQNEISLRRKSPSLARCKAADEMEFSFSKRLLLSHPFFVPSPFLSSPLTIERTSTHVAHHPNTQLVDCPPSNGSSVRPTIEFAARVERSKGHAQSDTTEVEIRRGARRGGGAITRRIGVSCLSKRPTSLEGGEVVSINEENRR